MISHMSRGEMIRRLDDISTLVRDGLATGPLSPTERDALASSLQTLLPIVEESLQDQEDRHAARALRPAPDARHEKRTMSGPASGWGAVEVHSRWPRSFSSRPFDNSAQPRKGSR